MRRFRAWEYQWMVPMPVRADRFQPLYPEHADLNVVTDLASLGPFSDTRKILPNEALLWSDLQTDTGIRWRFRAGSGRSGVYRDKYLKGIGRTLLCTNWNTDDRYHNSGHMLPSGALREFLVSAYVEARGKSHTIIPCEGYLIKAIEPSVQKVTALTWDDAQEGSDDLFPFDDWFQCITVKPFDHLRFCNLHWQVSNAMFLFRETGQWGVRSLLELLTGYLRNALGLPGDDLYPTPRELVALFRKTFDRARENFAAFREIGVFWGSYHANFTIDGRFLDLETATVLGTPTYLALQRDGLTQIPLLHNRAQLNHVRCLVGLELIDYAWDAHMFALHFRQMIEFFRKAHGVSHRHHREFLAELGSEWDKMMRSGRCWLGSGASIQEATYRLIADQLDSVGAAERKLLRALIRARYEDLFLQKFRPARKPVIFPLAPGSPSWKSEPSNRVRVFESPLRPVEREALETLGYFSEIFESLSRTRDQDRLLAESLRAREDILRRFGAPVSSGERTRRAA